MVATEDIGTLAAVLRRTWSNHRVVELEGPRRLTPDEIAAAFYEGPGPVSADANRTARFLEGAFQGPGE